eukprot:gene22493-10074_t
MPVHLQRSSSSKHWTFFRIAISLTVLQWNGAQSARRGCGTDRLAAYTNFAANSGKQVVTVAVAQYGLLRNNCSAFIYEEIFAQLHKSEKYVYVLDHFIHSNEIFAGHESGLVRKKVSGGNPNSAKIDLFIFEDYPECRFATTPQELVDMEVEPQLAKTCGKYGDAWGDKTCGVTLNYLRGLYSQKRVHDTIVAHEHSVKQKYDMVVIMRPDVLFTRQLELKYFDETADGLFAKPAMHKTFSPSWATFNGYNDRFFMGARDGVMHVLSRLDHVAERLRANAGLVEAQYLGKSEKKVPLDSLKICSEKELMKYTRDWAPVIDFLTGEEVVRYSHPKSSLWDTFTK